MKNRYEPGKFVWLWGPVVVVLLGFWHLLDVRAGVWESGDRFLYVWYGFLMVSSIGITVAAGWLLFRKKASMERIFAVCGLFLGILYLTVLPPLSAPDEVSHYISAYRLSSVLLGQPAADEEGRVYIREQDAFILDGSLEPGEGFPETGEEVGASVLGQTLTEQTYRTIHDVGIGKQGDNELVTTIRTPVATTPVAYLPQALGIAVGRLLGLGGIGLLYLGRLGNLMFYVAAVWYGMKRLPFGKEILFGVCLFPMTLHLTASFSYDTMILALSFLFTAVCLDLAYGAGSVRKRDVVLLAAVMAALGPCKMVYAVLMGLCLLIPVKKFGGRRAWILSAVLVLAAYGAAMVLVNSQTIAMYAGETESYVGWAEESGYTLGGLLHDPVNMLKIFYNTVLLQGEQYHTTMIGTSLGNLDGVLNVPYILIVSMTIGILLMAMKKPGTETVYFSVKQKIWIWFLCLACAGATMLSMLIAWTPASSGIILGVQGRYFLPFLPVLVMTFKNNWVILQKNRDREILFFMICANGYVLLRLFSIVSIRI